MVKKKSNVLVFLKIDFAHIRRVVTIDATDGEEIFVSLRKLYRMKTG